MADSKPQKLLSGCFSRMAFLVLLVACGGLVTAIYYIIQPQNLEDLRHPAPAAQAIRERDLLVVLKNALDRNYPVTFAEGEINDWLGRTLVCKQGGFFGDRVEFDRVWVRLEDGQAEVIMERKFLGKPFTVSMFLQVERMEGPEGKYTEIHRSGGAYHSDFPKPPRGGRFGKFVVPQGFLVLVMPAYDKLAAQFSEVLEIGFQEMSEMKMEKGSITFDPRHSTKTEGLPQSF